MDDNNGNGNGNGKEWIWIVLAGIPVVIYIIMKLSEFLSRT